MVACSSRLTSAAGLPLAAILHCKYASKGRYERSRTLMFIEKSSRLRQQQLHVQSIAWPRATPPRQQPGDKRQNACDAQILARIPRDSDSGLLSPTPAKEDAQPATTVIVAA
jgi:hypothetical protein